MIGRVAAFLVALAPSLATADDVTAMVRASTLKLTVHFVDPQNPQNECDQTGFGSGFIVSPKGYVLTVAHTFKPPKGCEIFTEKKIIGRIGYINSDQDRVLKVVAVDTASDLALLKLGAAPMPYPALPVCNDVALETGDKLVGFGFPLEDADFQHVDLVWQSDDGPGAIWVVSGLVTFGFSGGPLTDAEGRVIGLIKGGVSGVDTVRYAIPLGFARDPLGVAGIGILPDCSAASPAQVAQVAVEGDGSAGQGGPPVVASNPPPGSDLSPMGAADRTLKIGAFGVDVEELQRRLRIYGVYDGPVDGDFNARTDAAVRLFQDRNDIEATGVADVQTLGNLIKLAGQPVTLSPKIDGPNPSEQVDGWVYIGRMDGTQWKEVRFSWDGGARLPAIGAVIKPLVWTNLRQDHNRYDPVIDVWRSAVVLNVLWGEEKLVVQQLLDVTDGWGYIWAAVDWAN